MSRDAGRSSSNDFHGAIGIHGGTSFLGADFTGPVNFNSSADSSLLSRLRLTDPFLDRRELLARKDKLLPETCQWVCSDAAFEKWWASAEPNILWLHGDPGKGKTMMMCALGEEIARRINGSKSVLAYYFCQEANDAMNSAASVLRGLVFALVRDNRSLEKHLAKRFEEYGDRFLEESNAIYALREILWDIVEDENTSQVYLLVDALDECRIDSDKLLLFLTRDDFRLPCKARWLVSSRNEPDLRILGDGGARLHISLDLNSTKVTNAVEHYIDFKLTELSGTRNFPPPVISMTAKYLRQNANGTFLWVALVCKALSHPGLKSWKVEKTLKTFPSGLEALYERMMSQLEKSCDSEDCLSILRAMGVASQPLRLQELGFVADLDPQILDSPERVLELVEECGSFITAKENVVYFIHQSAKDYVISGKGRAIFNPDLQDFNEDVAARSINKMIQELHFNMCDISHPGVQMEVGDLDAQSHRLGSGKLHQTKKPGEVIGVALKYACLHWIYHVRQAGPRRFVSLEALMSDFFDIAFLFWIESLCLLGHFDIGMNGILDLEQYILNHVTTSIQSIFIDAKRLMMRFRPIIESAPLQIYSAVLLFSPQHSIIRSQFQALIPAWIKTYHSTDNEWGASLHTLECRISVHLVEFSPNGEILATSSFTPSHFNRIQLWDTRTGRELYSVGRSSIASDAFAFSPDGESFSIVVESGTIAIIKVSTRTEVTRLQQTWTAFHLQYSSDGRVLISTSRTRLCIWNLETYTGLEPYVQGNFEMGGLATRTHDGAIVLCGVNLETLILLDVRTGIELLHQSCILDIGVSDQKPILSPDGTMIAGTVSSRRVLLLDTIKGAIARDFGETIEVHKIAFSPDSRKLVTISHYREWRLWNIANGMCVYRHHFSAFAVSLSFSTTSQQLALALYPTEIKIFDLMNDSKTQVLDGHSAMIKSLAFSPQPGLQLLASGSLDGTARFWDIRLTENRKHFTDDHARAVFKFRYSYDGCVLASASDDETIKVWDTATGKLLRTLHDIRYDPDVLEISHNNELIGVIVRGGAVAVWNIATGAQLHNSGGYAQFTDAKCLKFSANSRLLATGFENGAVTIRNITDGFRQIETLKGRSEFPLICLPDPVHKITFSQNSTLVAVASTVNSIWVWNLRNGHTLYLFRSLEEIFQRPFKNLRFSAKNEWLMVERSVFPCTLWSLRTGKHLDPETTAYKSIMNGCFEWADAHGRLFTTDDLSINEDEDWLMLRGRGILWIPPEYRSHMKTYRDQAVLSTSSGKICFLKIDVHAPELA